MNKFGFAAVVASGLTAAILGLAAPAQAATPVNTPSVVPAAIDIPTDFGHRVASLTSSRMPTSRTGNHTPPPRGPSGERMMPRTNPARITISKQENIVRTAIKYIAPWLAAATIGGAIGLAPVASASPDPRQRTGA